MEFHRLTHTRTDLRLLFIHIGTFLGNVTTILKIVLVLLVPRHGSHELVWTVGGTNEYTSTAYTDV
jgi:hypothetical protein